MDTPDLSRILADLAAGRIDTVEASQRIEQLQGADAPDADDTTTTAHTGSGDPTSGSDPGDETHEGQQTGSAGATGASSSESWSAGAEAPTASDLLREVFRTARHAATRAADVAADVAAGAAAHSRADRAPGESAPAAGSAGSTGRASASARRISIRTTAKKVRVVVDPSVSSCHVTGEHVLRRNGDVIEVSAEGDFRPHLGDIKLPSPLRLDALRRPRSSELLIRVNPALALDVEVTAGNLQVSNVPRLGRVRLTAGSATITGFEQVEDALLQAAVVRMSGRIISGRSRIRVESGNLGLRLDDESNVTVVAASSVGRVTWSGRHTGAGDQVVMGNGSARLDVTVVMGHAGVQVGGHEEQAPTS